MKRNRGISYLEFIIVVAILGIFLGGIALTFSVVNSADIQSGAEKLDAIMERTKNECMAKQEQTYLVLYKSNDNDYPGYYVGTVKQSDLGAYEPTPKDDTKICKKELVVTVETQTKSPLDVKDNEVFFSFDRATGAFQMLSYGIPPTTYNDYPVSITITTGTKTSKINCVQATGKHYVE